MNSHFPLPGCNSVTAGRQSGLSLVELMISITLGLIILTAVISVFVSTSKSRNELEKNSMQIENGRYAMDMLREDIQLAGFYGDYMPITGTTWKTPDVIDPCTTKLNEMGFLANTSTAHDVPVGISGYPGAETAPVSCLSDYKSYTDVLVIRRVSTSPVVLDSNADNVLDTGAAVVDGEYYLQVSNCSDTPVESSFVLGKTPSSFELHTVKPSGSPATCKTGGFNVVRKYMTRIYYIRGCNDCSSTSGDEIPTLVMMELTAGTSACSTDPAEACGSMTARPLSEGIEDMQLEYGIDSAGTDGVPDSYLAGPASTDWPNVVAVKMFLRSRNVEASAEYTDNKTYVVDSGGSEVGPFGDHYRRHAYVMSARANNLAGRREQ